MARDFAIRNPQMLLENMVMLRDVFARRGLQCFLHYGTLLGAIREKGFIPHDDDADLGMFWSDFDQVVNTLPELMEKGFEFNSQRNGRMLQFVRNGEQVDIFFAVKVRRLAGHVWAIDERATVAGQFLDRLGEIDFLGQRFLIPSNPEKLMLNLYGKTWRIPLKDIPSRTDWIWKIAKIFKNPDKAANYVVRFLKMHKRKTSLRSEAKE